MTKPLRQFSANEGDYSVGDAGPDAIERDIDTLIRMFDPLTTHDTGESGGIAAENFQAGAITDSVIGNRTISDTIADAYSNTGILTKLLSFIAKTIKALKGTANWYDSVPDTISNIHTRVNTNQTSISSVSTALNTHKTSSDHDGRYYTETELNNGALDSRYYTETELNNGQLDSRYYTKDYLANWLNGGETIIHEEVFTIVNPNIGDGTFTYTINGVDNIVGTLLGNGEQVFALTDGYYDVGMNRLEVTVNDTLRRSVASGGVIEVGPQAFALTTPEGSGAEITVKYYEKIALAGEYNTIIGDTKPPANNGRTLWFRITG